MAIPDPTPREQLLALLHEDQRTGYAGVDLARATRLGAALWVIAFVCLASLFPLSPPTEALGKGAGWAIAGAIALSCLLGALRVIRKGDQLNPHELYAMSFGAMVSIGTVEWLAGGPGTPYHLIYLLSVSYTGMVHPPRRVLAYLAVLGPAMFFSFTYQDLSSNEIGTIALQYVISLGIGGVGLVHMAGTRAQRASLRSEGRRARDEAHKDFLTGLGNRRKLMLDLEECMSGPEPTEQVLALFDLDGFKTYNDSYGHGAGDDLLARMASRLGRAMKGRGAAYRMGGDEFCTLSPAGGDTLGTLQAASTALTESGEGFRIGSSYGSVLLPTEAGEGGEALRISDQRMYAQKNRGRTSAGRQSTEVLLQVLAERNPELGLHVDEVTRLCGAVAARVGLADDLLTPLLQAASLHDVGKAAIPDAILEKAGPLDEQEWAFMRRHTVIGERILSAAPALAPAAHLVRSSHERWDGTGYPDGLVGEQIPLGARIIFVCDAFAAMTATRSYARAVSAGEALAELRACAGTQFDPTVVEAFADALAASEALGIQPKATVDP